MMSIFGPFLLFGALQIKTTKAAEQSVLDIDDPNDPDYRPKIAIVGAGTAGATAAFHLQQKTRSMNAPPLLTVFESEPYVGGRVATMHAPARPWQGVSAGATSFHASDWCMHQAASAVGLSVTQYPEYNSEQTGLWNGDQLEVLDYRDWYPSNWRKYLNGVWKYGWAFRSLKDLVDNTQAKYSAMSPYFGNFQNLTATVARYGLHEEATSAADDYLVRALGHNEAMFNSIVRPTIRARLSAELEDVSALAVLLALRPADLRTIRARNWQLVNRLVRLSEAETRVSARVTKIRQAMEGGWLIEYENTQGKNATLGEGSDFVVLASDLRYSRIAIELRDTPMPPQEFRERVVSPIAARHVTYVSSLEHLSSSALSVNLDEPLPEDLIFSKGGGGNSGIISINVPYRILPRDTGDLIDELEYLYRIVSAEYVPDVEIARLFGRSLRDHEDLEDIGVTSIHRREWPNAFKKFEPGQHLIEEAQIARGLWYTAASEDMLTSLEMSCRMGQDAANTIYYNRLSGGSIP